MDSFILMVRMKGNRDRFHAGEDIFFPNPISQMMFMIKKPVQKRTGFRIKNSKSELLLTGQYRSDK
jgi:hypothetical protein